MGIRIGSNPVQIGHTGVFASSTTHTLWADSLHSHTDGKKEPGLDYAPYAVAAVVQPCACMYQL